MSAWNDFPTAAHDVVAQLSRQWGLDLWLVTRVEGDLQVVVAASGPWSIGSPGPPPSLSWPLSFCQIMASGNGPVVAPDVAAVPAYEAARFSQPSVHSYLGVPLETADGHLYGTLCGFGGAVRPDLEDCLDEVRLLARLLSTVLSMETLARVRGADATQAWVVAQLDRLTGLGNRLAWDAALQRELQRTRRHPQAVSVLVLDLDDLKVTNDTHGHEAGDVLLRTCAAVMERSSRPGDVLARVGGDEFAMLALECDEAARSALAERLCAELAADGVSASLGGATLRQGEDLRRTWRRADELMFQDKRRRKSATSDRPSDVDAQTPL